MRTIALTLALASAASGCSRQPQPDAYGNVEATEVVVGAEAAGQLVTFTVDEGQVLHRDAVVGTIDPTQLKLAQQQATAQHGAALAGARVAQQQVAALEAQRAAAVAQRDSARAQKSALQSQLDIATRAYDRTKRLFDQQAATAQQLDQAERDYKVLGDQIRAEDEQINAHDRQIAAADEQIRAARSDVQGARQQAAAAEAQVGQAAERVRKSDVRNPIDGTVLTTYVKAGEVVQIGEPLYRIANLQSLDVRAYVTETQLAAVRLGQHAVVSFDVGRGRQTVEGELTWISSRAEFTPTPVQTREERADLVYAIKIHVPNEQGLLKIGMPIDVRFVRGQAAS